MSTTISKLAVVLSANTGPFGTNLQKGAKDVDGFSARVAIAQGIVSGFAGGLTSFGVGAFTSGIQAAGSAVFDLSKKAVGLAATAEQNSISFEVMLGSADAAKTSLASLAKFAADTPFGSAEVVSAARQLIAFGSAGGTVQDELRTIGDVAAGISAPLGDIAYLYGTIRSQGKAMTVDINQFAGRGIPIWTALAEITGRSVAETRKLAEQGQITFDVIQSAFRRMTGEGGKFSGLMERQSKSLAGVWAALNDSVDMTLTRIAAGSLKMVDASTAVNSLSVATQALADVGIASISDAWERGGVSAQRFGDVAIDVLESVGHAAAMTVDAVDGLANSLHGAHTWMNEAAASSLSWIDMDRFQWARDLHDQFKVDAARSRNAGSRSTELVDKNAQFFAGVRDRMGQIRNGQPESGPMGKWIGAATKFGAQSVADAVTKQLAGAFRTTDPFSDVGDVAAITAAAAKDFERRVALEVKASAELVSVIQHSTDAWRDIEKEAATIVDDLKSPWERLQDQLLRIDDFVAAGLLSAEQAEAAAGKAFQDMPDAPKLPYELAAMERRFTAGMRNNQPQSEEKKDRKDLLKLAREQVQQLQQANKSLGDTAVVSIPH